MRRINLLPASFVEARRGRRRGIILGSLSGVLVWTVGLGAFVCHRQLAWIDARSAALQSNIAMKQAQHAHRLRLDEERSALDALVSMRKVAELPLQPSAALSALFELQPETIVLSKVLLETPAAPSVEVPLLTTSASSALTPLTQKKRESAKPLTLEINGYAMSDLDAAKFVGALSNHPAFEGVMLSSSKRVDVSGISRFQFQIRAEVPSDRQYVVVTADGGEVTP
jgi:hypothetical protein